jgi:hypothetical protein
MNPTIDTTLPEVWHEVSSLQETVTTLKTQMNHLERELGTHDDEDVDCECSKCCRELVPLLKREIAGMHVELEAQRAHYEAIIAGMKSTAVVVPAPVATRNTVHHAPKPVTARPAVAKIAHYDTTLADVLNDGETVCVNFGQGNDKQTYTGEYSNNTIDGYTASTFVKVCAQEHYGADHKGNYNGWAKCYVVRNGKNVILASLRPQ